MRFILIFGLLVNLTGTAFAQYGTTAIQDVPNRVCGNGDCDGAKNPFLVYTVVTQRPPKNTSETVDPEDQICFAYFAYSTLVIETKIGEERKLRWKLASTNDTKFGRDGISFSTLQFGTEWKDRFDPQRLSADEVEVNVKISSRPHSSYFGHLPDVQMKIGPKVAGNRTWRTCTGVDPGIVVTAN